MADACEGVRRQFFVAYPAAGAYAIFDRRMRCGGGKTPVGGRSDLPSAPGRCWVLRGSFFRARGRGGLVGRYKRRGHANCGGSSHPFRGNEGRAGATACRSPVDQAATELEKGVFGIKGVVFVLFFGFFFGVGRVFRQEVAGWRRRELPGFERL